MYYVIVPSEICAKRMIFTQNPRTADGRVVLTMRDLQMTHFSYGPVELVNETDLAILMQPAAADTPEENTPEEDAAETDNEETTDNEQQI